MKLAGQVIAAIGLYVYFPRIINILGRRFYRYPIDIYIKPGEEITSQHVLPIAFIAKELAEGRFIIRELEKSGITSKMELVEYLLDSEKQSIDQNKLKEAIEGVVLSLSNNKKSKIKRYTRLVNSRRQLIDQLILNELVMRQMNRKQEQQTRLAFNMLKGKWLNIVQKGESANLWELSVNQIKLKNELQTIGIKLDGIFTNQRKQIDSETIDSSREGKSQNSFTINNSGSKVETLNIELLQDNQRKKSELKQSHKINEDLLSRALLAYAFKQHHLDASSDKVNINMMEKVYSSRSITRVIKRFLNSDLKHVLLNNISNKGYRIVYDTEGDVLCISGIPNRNLRDKVMVIQIATRRNRILRELWLYEVTSTSSDVELVSEAISENQALLKRSDDVAGL